MSCKDINENGCCSLDMGRGCHFCNCGEESTAAVCEGCFKLHATDWLEDLPEMADNDIFEVRFKNTRRSYYRNVNALDLKRGDIVAVESSPGHDIGIVSLTGDMVARQMKRVGFNPLNGEFKKIYRKAKPYDIEKWQEAIALEHDTMIRSRQIASDMGLNMKIGDVEYQGDKIKAIFYYIADERVDFRELIKVFADQFRIRVEMRQIGARQEAGRIGGLGSCGRELCCASWISSFVSVTTNAARSQDISLNPQKLAGQCSKLKCCMVYELDTYLDARKEFPRINQPLQALDGDYHLVKTDILGRTMSFSTSPGSLAGMVTLSLGRVREIMDMNRRGAKPDRIEADVALSAKAEDPGFVNMIGEESITRFDSDRSKSRKSRKRGGKGGDGRSDGRGGQGRGGDGGARDGGARDGGARDGGSRDGGREGSRESGGGRTEKPRREGARPEGGKRDETRRDGTRPEGDRRGESGGRRDGARPEGDRRGGTRPEGGENNAGDRQASQAGGNRNRGRGGRPDNRRKSRPGEARKDGSGGGGDNSGGSSSGKE